MLRNETKLRVRYGETDRMGYCYYGNYATYYEVGRVEALRQLGFSYKEMEDKGVFLPVVEMQIQYKRPAYYDDELTIVTQIKELPGVKITFHYDCYNDKKELLNTGRVTLAFINGENGRPMPPPDWFLTAIQRFF